MSDGLRRDRRTRDDEGAGDAAEDARAGPSARPRARAGAAQLSGRARPAARGGEIDLILRERDGTLVFVEVRARRDVARTAAPPRASAGEAAPPRLRRAALPDAARASRRRADSTWSRSTARDRVAARRVRRRLSREPRGRNRACATRVLSSATMLEQRIQQQFFDSADLKYAAAESSASRSPTRCSALVGCITGGGKVLACGNGGSASDAQHFAAEFVGRFERERPGSRRSRSPPTPRSSPRSRNDYGFDVVFAKQVQALGAPGDVLLAMTTSGNSANVLAAIDAAHAKDMTVIALTGNSGGKMRELLTRNRRPHLRAARAHGAHPGGPPAGRCIACATRSTCNCSANRKTHEFRIPRAPARALALAARLGAARSRPARRCVVGGAVVGSAMVVTDRRTSRRQLEDEVIEVKAKRRASSEALGDRGGSSVDELQPHGAAHRRGADRGRQGDRRAGRLAASRTCSRSSTSSTVGGSHARCRSARATCCSRARSRRASSTRRICSPIRSRS